MALFKFDLSTTPWIHINTFQIDYSYIVDFPTLESRTALSVNGPTTEEIKFVKEYLALLDALKHCEKIDDDFELEEYFHNEIKIPQIALGAISQDVYNKLGLDFTPWWVRSIYQHRYEQLRKELLRGKFHIIDLFFNESTEKHEIVTYSIGSSPVLNSAAIYRVFDEDQGREYITELAVFNAPTGSYYQSRFKILSEMLPEYDIVVSVNGCERVFRFLNKEARDETFNYLNRIANYIENRNIN